MNWNRILTLGCLLCAHMSPVLTVYKRENFCENLRLAVVNFVGDDFDVYNKLLFEHSVFIYKKLCLHQNVSPMNFLLEDVEEDENDYITTPWNALNAGDPVGIMSRDRDIWKQQQQREGYHWFDKEL